MIKTRAVISGVVLLLVLLLTLLTFQNCGPGLMRSFSVQDMLSVTRVNADLAWSVAALSPQTDSEGRVTRWRDIKMSGINMYPPLSSGTSAFNLDKSGRRAHSADPYVLLADGASLGPSVSDIAELTGDRYTILLVVRNIIPYTEADPKVLRFFGLFPNSDPVGSLGLDIVASGDGGFLFSFFQWYNADNWAVLSHRIEEQALVGPFAIAIRYDKSHDNLRAAINGRILDEALSVGGNPSQLGYVARTLTLHAPEGSYGSKGSFSLSDFLIFKKAATDNELSRLSQAFHYRAIGLPASGNVDVDGEDDDDSSEPGPGPGLSGGELYLRNCQLCHGTLAQSNVRGRSLSQLNSAIQSVSAMSSLVSLTSEERTRIIQALSN